MVTNLGRAHYSTSKGWQWVETSGSPYNAATTEQIEYGIKYLIPYSKGKDIRLIWERIPSRAAALLSFILCIHSRVSYNEEASVSVLPGDRSVLFVNGEVKGYNDAVGRVMHLGDGTVDWQYTFSAFHRALAISNGLVTRVESDDVWMRVLPNLLRGYELTELTETLQSRLQWELRIRAGA